MTTVKIYCDGACKGNPGESGSGLAIYDTDPKPTLIYGDYDRVGTNNTAELKAFIKAMEISRDYKKTIILSDSRYSINAITKWAYGWKRNGWIKDGGQIKNLELIKRGHELYNEVKKNITVKYVRGHSGIEGNELADRMAVMTTKVKNNNYLQYHYIRKRDVLQIK